MTRGTRPVLKSNLLSRSNLPPEERGVAERLRAARRSARFTQGELGAAVGSSRATISNYEYGLAPVPFSFGLDVCRRLNLNQQYLAIGKSPVSPFVPLTKLLVAPELSSGFSGTFLEGYRELLHDRFTVWIHRAAHKRRGIKPGIASAWISAVAHYTNSELEKMMRRAFNAFAAEEEPAKKAMQLEIMEAAAGELRRRISL